MVSQMRKERAVGVHNGVLVCALRLGDGVGQGGNYRSSVPPSHLLEDGVYKCTPNCAQAHGHCRFHKINYFFKYFELLGIVVLARKVDFLLSQPITSVQGGKPFGADKPKDFSCLLLS